MKTGRKRFRVSVLATLVTLLRIGPAAQASEAVAPASDTSTSGGLQEIIVTAQKRAENLQDVPLTVSAVTAAQLAQSVTVTNLDLNMIVPGLDIETQGSYTLPAIRGVTTTLTNLGDEPNVSTYIDGVYYPVSFGQFMAFNNIDRVEVLKGPQGTLFGRNATGGAISIITKEPPAAPAASFSAGYGRFSEVDLNGYVGGPLTDSLRADVAAYSEKDHGWAENIFLHNHAVAGNSFGVRSKLLFQPTDQSRYTLALDYSKVDNPPDNFNIGGDSALKLVPGVVIASQPWTTASEFNITNPIYQLGASFTADLNFSGFDLISITAGRRAHADGHFDIDNTSVPLVSLYYGPKNVSGSEDFRFQSNDPHANLTWVVGVNAYLATDTYDPFDVIFAGTPTSQFGTVKTRALALYGQATQQLTDKLGLTLGARVSDEHKRVEFSQNAPGNAPGRPQVPDTTTGHTWGDFSPKLTVDYRFAPGTKGYATVSKGFKSGTYNVGSFQTTPVNPETLWDYEVGLKSDLTEHLRANVAAYYYDYRNIQVQAFLGSAVIANDTNAGRAKMKGMDADLTATYGGVITRSDSLNIIGGIALLDAYYSNYPGATLLTERPSGGDDVASADATGKRLIDAPRATVNLGITYSWLVPVGRLTVAPTAYYNSGYYLDSINTPRFRQGSFTRVNASVGWESPERHYNASIWGKNLTNVKQIGGVLASGLGAVANAYPPATFGVSVGYRF
jgi:iron complex outermembrane recepter protein